MALSGSLTTNTWYGQEQNGALKFSWTATQSITDNTSTISWTLTGVINESWIYGGFFKVVIDGDTVYSADRNYRIKLYDGTIVASGKKKLTHKEDGTRKFAVSVAAGIYLYDRNVEGSKTFTLDTIDAASKPTVSASSVPMGKSVTIYTNRKSSALTHDLTYSFGGVTGTIKKGVGDSCTWPIPLSLASKVPSAKDGNVTITCKTWHGETELGTETTSFTATVPDDTTTQPKVTMNVSAVESPFSGVYVAGKSKVKVSYDASSDYSTIKSYLTELLNDKGSTNPYTSAVLANAGTVEISGKVTDARGYFTKKTSKITVIEYSRPRIIPGEGKSNIVCTRCNSDGTVDPGGVYLRIQIGRKYWKVVSNGAQKNFCKLSYQWKTDAADDYSAPVELLARKATTDYVDVCLSGIVTSNTTAYNIRLIAEDDVGEEDTVTINIPTAFVTWNVPPGGHGWTLGGYHDPSKHNVFDCWFDAEFHGEVHGIYSQGETDGWYWRKYSDGIAECWRRVKNEARDITTQFGSMYYADCDEVTFPFSFYTAPVVTATVESGTALTLLSWQGTDGNGTTTASKPASYRVIRPTTITGASFTIAYHAIGRWKE